MKIFLFLDNYVGLEILKFLKNNNENIIGIALHPKKFQNHTEKIKQIAKLSKNQIFIGSKKPSKKLCKYLNENNPDLILTIFWRYILKKNIFELAKFGCINFHLSYLPYNRGKKPNFWPFIDQTPAGVSLHFIDYGIDSGKIIARKKVKIGIFDDAKSIYEKQLILIIQLFKLNWKKIKTQKIKTIKNNLSKGTFHYDKEFLKYNNININKKMKVIDFINLIKAKSFPPHEPLYFYHNRKKIYLSIKLTKNKYE